jgi:hypothetical protein
VFGRVQLQRGLPFPGITPGAQRTQALDLFPLQRLVTEFLEGLQDLAVVLW